MYIIYLTNESRYKSKYNYSYYAFIFMHYNLCYICCVSRHIKIAIHNVATFLKYLTTYGCPRIRLLNPDIIMECVYTKGGTHVYGTPDIE